MSGHFISFEGGEGVGKSTQARIFAERLRARGAEVVETREPGGTPNAEAIRALLLSGERERWDARAEVLLFAAARADHVARVIRPALERGAWVVCDRFIDSTLAYQGGAGGISNAQIRTIHDFATKALMPELTLLLELDDSLAAERAHLRDEGAADRFAAKGAAYHARVASAFAALAHAEPRRIRRIGALGSVDTVADAVWAAVQRAGLAP